VIIDKQKVHTNDPSVQDLLTEVNASVDLQQMFSTFHGDKFNLTPVITYLAALGIDYNKFGVTNQAPVAVTSLPSGGQLGVHTDLNESEYTLIIPLQGKCSWVEYAIRDGESPEYITVGGGKPFYLKWEEKQLGAKIVTPILSAHFVSTSGPHNVINVDENERSILMSVRLGINFKLHTFLKDKNAN